MAFVNAGELETNTLELEKFRSDPATSETKRVWITLELEEKLLVQAVGCGLQAG